MLSEHIYIHIPFCERVCIYCDFSVTTSRKYFSDYTASLNTEIKLSRLLRAPAIVKTVYFGGGTPSFLPNPMIESIVYSLKSNFTISPLAEWTIEVNPNHLSLDNALFLKKIGFNRISIGVQSFDNDLLRTLTRIHDADQAKNSVFFAREAGFFNINIDLIYALPRQSVEQWQADVEQIIAYRPEHVSLYALGIEEGTPLKRMVDKNRITIPEEEIFLDYYLYAERRLTEAGYEHYEISNFAQPGFRSLHNSAYWKRVPYLGLGSSAHSFDGIHRWWNHRRVDRYIESCLTQNTLPIEEKEFLTEKEILKEILLLGFRKSEGVSFSVVEPLLGKSFNEYFYDAMDSCKDYLIFRPDSLALNTQGWFLYNTICRKFMECIP